jgi:hypothetical protein
MQIPQSSYVLSTFMMKTASIRMSCAACRVKSLQAPWWGICFLTARGARGCRDECFPHFLFTNKNPRTSPRSAMPCRRQVQMTAPNCCFLLQVTCISSSGVKPSDQIELSAGIAAAFRWAASLLPALDADADALVAMVACFLAPWEICT